MNHELSWLPLCFQFELSYIVIVSLHCCICDLKWPWNAGCYVQWFCNCPIPFFGAFVARAWPLVLQADCTDGITIFPDLSLVLLTCSFSKEGTCWKMSTFLTLVSYQLLCLSKQHELFFLRSDPLFSPPVWIFYGCTILSVPFHLKFRVWETGKIYFVTSATLCLM